MRERARDVGAADPLEVVGAVARRAPHGAQFVALDRVGPVRRGDAVRRFGRGAVADVDVDGLEDGVQGTAARCGRRTLRHEEADDLAEPTKVLGTLELRECLRVKVLSRVSLLPPFEQNATACQRTSSLACLVVMPVMWTRVRCRTRTLALFCMTASVSLRRLSLSFLAACRRFILRDSTTLSARSIWTWKRAGTYSSGLIALNSTVASSYGVRHAGQRLFKFSLMW